MARLYYAGTQLEILDEHAHELLAFLNASASKGLPRDTWSVGTTDNEQVVLLIGPDIPIGVHITRTP